MAAFDEHGWDSLDCRVIAESGLATIVEEHQTIVTSWLVENGYTIDVLDRGGTLDQTVAALETMLEWESKFGYKPDPTRRNLDALNDGFYFDAPQLTGRVLQLGRIDVMWRQDKAWTCGLLDIAQRYSRSEMAFGRRFLTLLVVKEQSVMIGQIVGQTYVPYPIWRPGIEPRL